MAKKKPNRNHQAAKAKKAGQKKPSLQKAATKKSPPPTGQSNQKSGPTEPSRPTVKRLFALSGNRCVFPKCPSPLVDPQSGSIIGEICHIKGEKRGSKRYDKDQTDSERHGFENLILMCGPHHKVIDDDEKTYPVELLTRMKKRHEAGQPKVRELTDEEADRLIATISGNAVTNGSIIQTQQQTGGQVAHTINNYQQVPPPDEEVVIDGKLTVTGDLRLVQIFGCPGAVLTVACRSKRSAKIRSALLCVEGHGFLAALERGFEASFDHTPPEGHETETFSVNLARLQKPNSPEGYILNRDDVCRFYLPMCVGGLGLFLTAPAESVTIRVVFFDDSHRDILRGEEAQGTLKGLVEAHGDQRYELKVPITMSVQVAPKTLPKLSGIVGTTNRSPVSFTDSSANQATGGTQNPKVNIEFGVMGSPATHEYTLGLRAENVSSETISRIGVAFVAHGGTELPFAEEITGPLSPGQGRTFALPFRSISELKRLVGSLPTDRYAFVIRSEKEELLRIPGEYVQRIAVYMEQVSREQAGVPVGRTAAPVPEHTEESDWLDRATKARLRWMDENPY